MEASSRGVNLRRVLICPPSTRVLGIEEVVPVEQLFTSVLTTSEDGIRSGMCACDAKATNPELSSTRSLSLQRSTPLARCRSSLHVSSFSLPYGSVRQRRGNSDQRVQARQRRDKICLKTKLNVSTCSARRPSFLLSPFLLPVPPQLRSHRPTSILHHSFPPSPPLSALHLRANSHAALPCTSLAPPQRLLPHLVGRSQLHSFCTLNGH